MLIDEALLSLDGAEADRVYAELKVKSERRRDMEMRQNRLSSQMSLDEETIKRIAGMHTESSSGSFISDRSDSIFSQKRKDKKGSYKEEERKE
jgi:hypothetical protein